MTCDEASILMHALIDGELDAGHAREVETHIAGCAALRGAPARVPRDAPDDDAGNACASQRRRHLRARIEGELPAPAARALAAGARSSRAFAFGAALSARSPRQACW